MWLLSSSDLHDFMMKRNNNVELLKGLNGTYTYMSLHFLHLSILNLTGIFLEYIFSATKMVIGGIVTFKGVKDLEGLYRQSV